MDTMYLHRSEIMKVNVIKIGNSMGIRLPRLIVRTLGVNSQLELTIANEKIILVPLKKVRKDWESAFKKMNEDKEDKDNELIMSFPETEWDKTEWTW